MCIELYHIRKAFFEGLRRGAPRPAHSSLHSGSDIIERTVDTPSVPLLLASAYEALRVVDLDAGARALEDALSLDFDNPEVLFALKCARYWAEGLERVGDSANAFERGEMVLGLWKSFAAFQARLEAGYEPCRHAFKQFAFRLALSHYRSLPSEESEAHRAEMSLRIGRCLKGAGDYDEAIRELALAARERRDDPEALAELADAYALVNEMRDSKALFREAFYLGASKVDLDFLESEMIVRLVAKVREAGREGPALSEWIPVYGNLLGVFTVKRELKAVEAGKLRQSIYQLETELRENAEDRALIAPRLVNRYFWLIDHCIAAREERAKVEEILLKLRLLDPQIHKQYTA